MPTERRSIHEPESGIRSRFGNVRRLPSGRWQARYRSKGGEQNCTPGVTYETKADAWDVVGQFAADRQRGIHQQSATPKSLAGFAEEWYLDHTASSPPATKADYRSALDNLVLRPGTPLEGVTLAEITPGLVRWWLTALSRDWVDPRTGKPRGGVGARRRVKGFRILSLVLKSAVEERHIATNPCTGITPVLRGEVKNETRPHYYLYLPEIARLVAAAYALDEESGGDVGWGEYFEVMAWTGMRPGEVKALRPERVLASGHMLHVKRALSEGNAETGRVEKQVKGLSARYPYMPKAVGERLQARIERLGIGRQDLIWTDSLGQHVWSSTQRDAWNTIAQWAGVWPDEGSFLEGRRQWPWAYDLRAALVTHLQGAGIPSIEVQAQVGHEDDAVMRMYTVIADAGLQDPIPVAARTACPPMRNEVIEYLYAEANKNV